jgi:hypothetical protein
VAIGGGPVIVLGGVGVLGTVGTRSGKRATPAKVPDLLGAGPPVANPAQPHGKQGFADHDTCFPWGPSGRMCRMAILELVQQRPDWIGALEVAMTRPPGVPERRRGEDPWKPKALDRPRRISDDLAWFRDAYDEPAAHGLMPLRETATVAAWEGADEEAVSRLTRLRDRGILDAAGFMLHGEDDELDFEELLRS